MDCMTASEELDGNAYWIERTGNKVQAYAHELIKCSTTRDPSKRPRPIDRAGLPTEGLRKLFDHLKAGGDAEISKPGCKQANLPRSRAWWEKNPLAEVAGEGGQAMNR